MSTRRHAYSQGLSSEDTTLIRDLTREILSKEGLGFIPVKIKPKVWSTAFFYVERRDRRTGEIRITDQKIQFGGKMLTGSMFPKRIYYISIFDPSYIVTIIRSPRDIMLADILASTILEEVAHAIIFNTITLATGKAVKDHGGEFIGVLRELWIEYFITLKFKLMSVYGNNGISGEDVL